MYDLFSWIDSQCQQKHHVLQNISRMLALCINVSIHQQAVGYFPLAEDRHTKIERMQGIIHK
jgi:hypothetical protein